MSDPYEVEFKNLIGLALMIAVSLAWSDFFKYLFTYLPIGGLFGSFLSAMLMTLIAVILIVPLKRR